MKNSVNESDIKKIAIVTQKMIIGGVEKALIPMLEQLYLQGHKLTVYLVEEGGELRNKIPDNVEVKVLPWINQSVIERIKETLTQKDIKLFFRILSSYAKLKLNKNNFIKECQMSENMLPDVDEKYDIAISYHAPSTIPMFYVIDRIKADQKILWIHGNVQKTGSTTSLCEKYYKKYDKIICVSEQAKEKFIESFPLLDEKTYLIYNIIYREQILKLAEQEIQEMEEADSIKLVTVGRLSKEKGIDLACKVCHKLVEKGYPIQWFICGEGDERKRLEEMIRDYNISEHFFLLGSKENPYPYIKKSDIYVQPSLHEGYCLTLAEARILCKPIVSTDFSGAREQLGNKKGLIVNSDEGSLTNGIELLINNADIRLNYIRELKKDSNEPSSKSIINFI